MKANDDDFSFNEVNSDFNKKYVKVNDNFLIKLRTLLLRMGDVNVVFS